MPRKPNRRPQILQPLSTLGILESLLIELGIHVDGPSAADHLIAIVLAGCDHLGLQVPVVPQLFRSGVAEQWRRYSFRPGLRDQLQVEHRVVFYAAHKVAEFFGLVFRQWISLLFHTLCRYIQFNRHNRIVSEKRKGAAHPKSPQRKAAP